MDRERHVAGLARRQHGLISADQAEALGISPDARRRRVRSGRWIRLNGDVFALAGTANTWRQKTMAAVLAAGPGAVASHSTAGALYGLSCCSFKGVEITVPRGRSHRRQQVTVHQSGELARVDLASIDGIPVTRPARSLVDLAGQVSPAVLREAVDDALVRRLLTLQQLEARAQSLGGSGRAGSRILRKVLRSWAGGDVGESVAEMRMVRRLVAGGQPPPVLQYRVCDDAGREVARLDAAYPDERVGVEMQGFRWHGTPHRFVLDAQRFRRLAALGWLILPCTPTDLTSDGRALAAQVGTARERAHPARRCG